MTSPKTYQLTVTKEQAKTIQDACELLSRIQGGQVREVFSHLPLRKGVDWNVYHEIQDELTKRMPEILKDGIDGWSSSFGVGHPDLPKSHDIAWDLYQVIRYELSTEKAIEEGIIENKGERKFPEMMTVNYDKPIKFGSEPLATMEKVTKSETGWTLVRYAYDGDRKVYETLYEGTQYECSKYAFDTFGEDIGMCLLDPQGREWDL